MEHGKHARASKGEREGGTGCWIIHPGDPRPPFHHGQVRDGVARAHDKRGLRTVSNGNRNWSWSRTRQCRLQFRPRKSMIMNVISFPATTRNGAEPQRAVSVGSLDR